MRYSSLSPPDFGMIIPQQGVILKLRRLSSFYYLSLIFDAVMCGCLKFQLLNLIILTSKWRKGQKCGLIVIAQSWSWSRSVEIIKICIFYQPIAQWKMLNVQLGHNPLTMWVLPHCEWGLWPSCDGDVPQSTPLSNISLQFPFTFLEETPELEDNLYILMLKTKGSNKIFLFCFFYTLI